MPCPDESAAADLGWKKKERRKIRAQDKIRGFPVAVSKENVRLLCRGESDGLRFVERPRGEIGSRPTEIGTGPSFSCIAPCALVRYED